MNIAELSAKISNEFDVAIKAVPGFADMFSKTASGVTYAEAEQFARVSGQTIGNILFRNMKEAFPDGVISLEDAMQLIPPALRDNYAYVEQVTKFAQETLNKNAGIGLKPVVPKYNPDRAAGLATEVANAENFIETEELFIKQVENASMSIVDKFVRENANAHRRAGLDVVVVRKYDGVGLSNKRICMWCKRRSGRWDYDDAVDNGVFERHPGCGCEIAYITGKSVQIQTDWTQNAWEEVGRRRR